MNRRRVQEWIQQENDLKKAVKKGFRVKGGGRKVSNPDMDNTLLKWLLDRRSAGGRVTGKKDFANLYTLHIKHSNY